MPAPTHLDLLSNGVEHWNKSRRSVPFPDFSDADIYDCFCQNNMIDSDGNIPPLTGADFRYADLSGASLCNMAHPFRGLDLSEANFERANLRRAFLKGADLRRATFPRANLADADLRYANLADADLASATLVGADLSATQPWLARLFEASNVGPGPSTDGLDRRVVSCVADVIDYCSELDAARAPDTRVYFRGESDDTWSLGPSVMRASRLRLSESEMLLEAMSRRPEDFSTGLSALAQWVRAQHYGLKTRLLDVTRNPLVALFNACGGLDDETNDEIPGRVHVFVVPRRLVKPHTSDTVSIVANFAKLSRDDQDTLLGRKKPGESENSDIAGRYRTVMAKLYHLIRQERTSFYEEIDPRDFFRVLVVEPQQSFERIRAQSGAFLISAYHERFERSEIQRRCATTPVYDHKTLQIPPQRKCRIRKELSSVNITREALLPSLDETAKAITQSYSTGG